MSDTAPVSDAVPVRWPRVGLHVLALALLALIVEQVQHETTHGVVAVLVGARWERLHLMACQHSWPAGVEPAVWRNLAIKGSAALLNILCAAALIWALRDPARWSGRPRLRLFAFYFALYSCFAGFGYLMVDPLFARPGSVGDWAAVVMLLGGGWGVRLPIIAVGAAGVLYGLFWSGRTSLGFTVPGAIDGAGGAALLLLPFVGVNLVFTGLFYAGAVPVFGPELGPKIFLLSCLKIWCGFSLMFWAFMGSYVWTDAIRRPSTTCPVPTSGWGHLVLVGGALVVIAVWLLPGIWIQRLA